MAHDLIEEAKELLRYGSEHDDSADGAVQQAQTKALISIAESLRELATTENVEFSTKLHTPAD